jgi:hypothetical protein
VSDGQGTLLATVPDSVEAAPAADGNAWGGAFRSTSADPSGTVRFVGGGTVEATRIAVQPLATPAAGTPVA